MMIDIIHPDDCCNKPMRKADLSTIQTWTCPKCGCEWRPRLIRGIRCWEPHELIAIF